MRPKKEIFEVNEELREIATVILDIKTNMDLAQKYYKKAQIAIDHADHRIKRLYQYDDLVEPD